MGPNDDVFLDFRAVGGCVVNHVSGAEVEVLRERVDVIFVNM